MWVLLDIKYHLSKNLSNTHIVSIIFLIRGHSNSTWHSRGARVSCRVTKCNMGRGGGAKMVKKVSRITCMAPYVGLRIHKKVITLKITKCFSLFWSWCHKINFVITDDTIKYIRTNALMYEYYKQAREMIPNDIGKTLSKIFTSEEYIMVNTRFDNPSLKIFSFLVYFLES